MVAAPTSLPARQAHGALFARVDAAAVRLLFVAIGLSFAVRVAAGWLRATPNYFADEYLYAELGRSLVESGRPSVRGVSLELPALLQPVLTAPAWLVSDVWVSYRLIQALGALAMSLAAVPVFLLARRVGVARPLALGAAAFAVAIPDLLFAGWIVSEPFAYPVFLFAVLGAVVALAEPSRRTGLLFVGLAALAAFARAQFLVLPLCFLVAVLVVGLRERRVRAVLREQALPLAFFAGAALFVLLLGTGLLGMYQAVLELRAGPAELVERVGLNSLVLAYSSGWILLPGALLGFGLALARPRSRAELALGGLTVPLVLMLLLEAAVAGAVDVAQERYVFYVLPLAAVGFCLYAARGLRSRTYVALVAAGLLAASAAVPLAGFAAAEGKTHSPLLIAAFRIEQWLGSPAAGSLAFAAAAAALLAAGVALSGRRIGALVALALAVAAGGVTSAAATSFDTQNAAAVRQAFLPAEPSWVDKAGVGDVLLVRGEDGVRTEALEQLFWNRSIEQVALLPGAEELDHVHAQQLKIGPDGTLRVGRERVRSPLLVDGYASTIRLADAELLASSQSFALWRPNGVARVSLVAAGRYGDGWLARAGAVFVWPHAGARVNSGVLRLTLTAPDAGEPMTIRFRGRDVVPPEVRLEPGVPQAVAFPYCTRGVWRLRFEASSHGFVGSRVVSAHSAEPELLPVAGCKTSTRERVEA